MKNSNKNKSNKDPLSNNIDEETYSFIQNDSQNINNAINANVLKSNDELSESEQTDYTNFSTDNNSNHKNESNSILDKLKDNDSPVNDGFLYKLVDNITYLFPTIIAGLIYSFSQQGCNKNLYECLDSYSPFTMYYITILVVLSAISFYFNVVLYFNFNTNPIFFIINITVFLAYLFFGDNGTTISNHSHYNQIILIFSVGILTLIHCTIYMIIKKPIQSISLLVVIILVIYFKVLSGFDDSCSNWSKGFKNTTIKNHLEYKCVLNPPQTCTIKQFSSLFDFNGLNHLNKNNFNDYNKDKGNDFNLLIDSFINYGTIGDKKSLKEKDYFKIIFPQTKLWKPFPNMREKNIQKTVLKNLVFKDLESTNRKLNDNILESDSELHINRKLNTADLKFNINRNETLVKERNEQYKKFDSSDYIAKNVLILELSSISRIQFKEKLPNFFAWMEEKYSNITIPSFFPQNGKEKPEDYDFPKDLPNTVSESFQFFRYNSVGHFSAANSVPLNFGTHIHDETGSHYVNYYKERGFITGQSINYCGRETFGIEIGDLENFDFGYFDHELQSIFCDPNLTPIYDGISQHGPSMTASRSLYGKPSFKYSLDYALDFFNKYNKEFKLFKLGLVDGFDGSTELIKQNDFILVEFFKEFERLGYLKDTYVIIFSDNGNNAPGPFAAFNTEDWKKELSLPALFLMIPSNDDNYPLLRKNLKSNENKLVYAFNIYNTIMALLGDGGHAHRSRHEEANLMIYVLEDYLTCENISIPKEICICN